MLFEKTTPKQALCNILGSVSMVLRILVFLVATDNIPDIVKLIMSSLP